MITSSTDGMFWTPSYGAFRWHECLMPDKGQWQLVSMQMEFDRMRDVPNVHIDCVVDDFGNLVGVKQ